MPLPAPKRKNPSRKTWILWSGLRVTRRKRLIIVFADGSRQSKELAEPRLAQAIGNDYTTRLGTSLRRKSTKQGIVGEVYPRRAMTMRLDRSRTPEPKGFLAGVRPLSTQKRKKKSISALLFCSRLRVTIESDYG